MKRECVTEARKNVSVRVCVKEQKIEQGGWREGGGEREKDRYMDREKEGEGEYVR
jgi:hypothetical protein